MNRVTRFLVYTLAGVGLFLATGERSQACWGWLFGGGCCGTGTTTYRPWFGGCGYGGGYGGCGSSCGYGGYGYRGCGYHGCGSCCETSCCPQTCHYVPQTCCRTECVNVPVTTYRCCRSCDPCTGCPTTVMRPVTTYVRHVRRVPVTTYRLVCSPCNDCSSCGSGCGTGAVSGYGGSPSCCNTYGAESGATIVPSTPAPVITSPALPSDGLTPGPQTYEGSSTRLRAAPRRTAPVANPEFEKTASREAGRPAIRSASMPVHRAGTWRSTNRSQTDSLVFPAQLVQTAPSSVDDGGWRAARE